MLNFIIKHACNVIVHACSVCFVHFGIDSIMLTNVTFYMQTHSKDNFTNSTEVVEVRIAVACHACLTF